MAKRRSKRRGGSRSKKLPLAIVVPMAVTGVDMAKQFMAGNTAYPQYVMTGITANGDFQMGRVIQTYLPIATGLLIHKGAGRLGVNRYIPKWLPVSI